MGIDKDSDPELGSLPDPDGRLEQALPASSLSVPWLIELRDGGLFYAHHSPDAFTRPLPELNLADRMDVRRMHELGHPVLKPPKPHVLDEFISLAGAPEEQFLAFAQRWGVLDLCEHALPFGHDAGDQRWGMPPHWRCRPRRVPDPRFPDWAHYGFEPLEDWLRWACRAEALLKIAANLHAFRRGRIQDWDIVATWEGQGLPRPGRGDGVDDEWRLLCSYVIDWCEAAHVSPSLQYQGDGMAAIHFGSRWGPGRLFGTIGIQLMARVGGVGSIAVCVCGRLFTPKRFPKPLELSYCRDCQKRKVSVLVAKRRLAARKLEACELSKKGLSIPKIAHAVERDPATVRRWVGKGRRRTR